MSPLLTGVLASQISGHLNTYTLTGSYDALATVTVPSGGASSITFSAIPQTGYKHLQIRALAQVNSGSTSTGGIRFQFNSDAGSNYSLHRLYGTGSGSGSSDGYSSQTTAYAGIVSGSGSTNIFGASVIDVLDYANTNKNKTIRTLGGADTNGAGIIMFPSSAWYNTSAINTITVTSDSGNFTQYSQFSLYGVK